jgi:tRNA modification GTPase
MTTGDTIAAISSAVAPAARIILRISGPQAFPIATELSPGIEPKGSSARRATLSFNDLTVPATLYTFVAPHSYSGEDIVEFHIPGNPLLARMLLDETVRLGARPADPGEFTARAYFNGRIDLTEAEGVAATISALGEGELRAARQLAAGELARRLRPILDSVAETLGLVEVGIDFSEEDVTFLSPDAARARITSAEDQLAALVAQSARFERLAHEPQIVLVGRPNAGKSTLLNALANSDRAVVSSVPGTTRDTISADIALSRGIVRIVDVAGLEDERRNPATDVITAQMRDHTLRAVDSADILVLVREINDRRTDIALNRKPDLVVQTKSDLSTQPTNAPSVSAHTGENLNLLHARLDALAFGDSSTTGEAPALALNARHLRHIGETQEALRRAQDCTAANSPELLALELRSALDSLGEILGNVSPDDLLGAIFSKFCIGK